MAELERPRIRAKKKHVQETTAEDEEQQLEERLHDLKEFFTERQNENAVEMEVELDSHTEPDQNQQAETINESNEIVENLTNEQQEQQTSEEVTNEQNPLTDEISTSPPTEASSNIYEKSSFLYPQLSTSLWSPATAPLPSLDIDTRSRLIDPYSIENFNPTDLQIELRQTYLPFINITDECFLAEHYGFITNNPRHRSLLTRDESDNNETNDDDDEFYFLISSFYDIRTKIDHLTNEYDVLQRKIASLLPHVWSFSCEKIESGSYCGDNIYLKRSILFEQANFDRNLSKEIDDTLKQLRTIIYQQYVALKYETLWYKMKIDLYMTNLLASHTTVSSSKLLHTIEILFNFQRYRTRDVFFYTYTRQLIKQTVDLVYKHGNYNETLFIINHILRCPPGIHTWATSFVRLLLPGSFDILCSPIYIRYAAHFLAALLFPIANRDIFLENWLGENGETVPQTPSSPPSSNKNQQQQQWMLIDADGHERAALLRWDTLNEDDLIALLNQFNLNYLMRLLFGLNESRQTMLLLVSNVSYGQTVRTLAILDLFVEILCHGFETYADSQYKNFHKHIGKMIRDCVHACRYHVDGVIQRLDEDEKNQLRNHYFAYIYRSVENIIRQCRNVRWSLLSLFALFDLPPSLQRRLLHLICSIPDDEPVTVETSAAVDRMLNSSTPSEILSLLKVLHNLGQTGDEGGQISNVIFYITCLHPISREYSLRDGRSILAHFVSIRPSLISHLLDLASTHLDVVGKVLFGLFRALPMDIWMPNDHDLSLIETWLNDLSESSSIAFQLALHLIDAMNWQYLPHNNNNKQQLCISYTIHCEMALILLKIHLKYCEKSAASKENQQQTQIFVKNSQINLDQWIWTALLRLQLNQSCLSVDSFIDSMSQEHVGQISQTNHHVRLLLHGNTSMSDEVIGDIRRAIEQYHSPVAYYISFGLDQAGASATGFFEGGIEHLFQLVQNGKYPAAIRVLHDMSGILVRSVDYLIEHNQFMTTLKTLLNVPDTSMSLLKTASSYIIQSRASDGTINAKLLTAALLDLLIWLEDNPKFRRLVLLFWFKLLSAMKDWNRDNSILFILDHLLAHSFVHDVMDKEVTDHLFELAVSALNPRQNQQNTRSGFLAWLPLPSAVTSTQTYWSSLSIESSLLSRYPTVSYFFLNAENSFEIDQNVLVELKAELEQNPTGKVDAIWKKLIQQRHYPIIPLTSLSIYRWGTMACEMPVNHPLLPIVWEKFFTIFLSKHANGLHRVGYRLFETPQQTTFLKQMKRALATASEHYTTVGSSSYANKLATFFHSLSLWIDEPRLHDPQLNIVTLPTQYDNERLAHLFNADNRILDIKWLELIDIRQMYETLVTFTNTLWPRPRTNRERTPSEHRSVMTTAQKLIDLVSNVQRPPALVKSPSVNNVDLIGATNQSLPTDPIELKSVFERELNKIINWLQTHCQRHERQIELDQTIMDLLPLLWKNEFQEQSIQASCQNALNPVHQCTRPAYIIVRYKSKQQCQSSNQRLEVTLNEHKQLLTDACRSCDLDMCRSMDILNHIVHYLTRQLSAPLTNENLSLSIIDTGTQLFYAMLTVYNDQYSECMQPLHEQLDSLLDTLGEIFVKSNPRQPQAILEYIVLNRPNIPRLILYFNPNAIIQPDKFIDIYSKLSKMFCFIEQTTYLLQMFRKFNINQWFELVSSQSSHRTKFIETLFTHFRSLIENFTLAAKRDHPPGYDELPLIEQTSQLFDITIGHMIQILNYSYPSQIGYVYRNLIESIQIMRKKQKPIQQQQQNTTLTPLEFQQSIERGLLPTKILSEFIDQLLYLENTSSITLGIQQIDEMLVWLQTFVLKQITDTNEQKTDQQHLVQLYLAWKPCLNELMRIYSIIFMLNIQKRTKHPDLNIHHLIEQLISLYELFINPQNSFSNLNEWKTIIDHHGDMLTRLIKTFIQSCQQLFEHLNESYSLQQQFFTSLLHYWYKIVKYLLTNEYTHPILDIYHRYLPRLTWINYRPTMECLLIFDELIIANNSEISSSISLYEFILHILSTVDIHAWMIRNDEKTIAALVPIYFRLLINIFLCPQAKYTQNNDGLSRLASQSESINWTHLDFDTYVNVLNSTIAKLDNDFILAPRASIDGYLNRILRSACEFNSSSLLADQIRFKRLCYLRLIEQCLINGKNQHNHDEYRLALVNLLNDIESLALQGKLSLPDELEDIFLELIRFLNVGSLGQNALNSYHNYFLDWIRQSQSSITMLPLLTSVCRTIKDSNRKILLIETILYVYFMHDDQRSWSIIFDLFVKNDSIGDGNGKLDNYISWCCEHNALLTLYLYSECQAREQQSSSSTIDILENEFQFLEKLIELLTSGKLRIVHGEEERVLLLMSKINTIIVHQLEYGKSNDFLLTRLIRNYAHWLLILGTDNKEYAYSGLLAVIGIGKKAQYSLRFRLFVKLLGIMQLEQLTDEPFKVRIDSNDRRPDLTSANNLILKQSLTNLTLTTTAPSSEYSDYKNEIIHCNSEFLQRPDINFFHVAHLINYLYTHLFPDLSYLSIVSKP